MNILILEHNKDRERLRYEFIVERLKEMSPDSKAEIHPFDNAMEIALAFPPDVILSHPVRDEIGATVMTALKLLYHCKIVCLTTEGLDNINLPEAADIRLGSFNYSEKLIDFYFYWGEKTKEFYLRNLLERKRVSDPDRVGLSGYVLFEKETVEKYINKYGIGSEVKEFTRNYEKNYCFVTAAFKMHDPIEEAEKSEILRKDMPREEYERIKQNVLRKSDYRYEYGKRYLAFLGHLAEKHPNYGFLVKLHPIEISTNRQDEMYEFLTIYKNIFFIKEPLLMPAVLNQVDGLFHYGSSTAVEAYLYKVPTVRLYMKGEGEDAFVNSMGDRYEYELSETLTTIFDLDAIVYSSNRKMEQYLIDFFGYRENRPYHPTKTVVLELIGGKDRQDISFEEGINSEIMKNDVALSLRMVLYKRILQYVKRGKWNKIRELFIRLKTIQPRRFGMVRDFIAKVKMSMHSESRGDTLN